jgi:antitoxin component of RelBE/YafQ-DinJ toxin-antitoxin module
MPVREMQVNVKLSQQEAERAVAIATHYELTIPGVIRMLLKREGDALSKTVRATSKR